MSVLIYEKKGRIAYLTMNRPERLNAMGGGLGEALSEAWQDFREDPELWIAIVTGAGDRAFSSGADLVAMSSASGPTLSPGAQALTPNYKNVSIMRGMECWKPIIAAINGYAVGGGLELALSCDIRIAADVAQLGLGEVRWSLIPGGGGTQRLPRAIPLGIAMELLMTGDRVTAQRAYEVGLVNYVVPQAELMARATALAERICQNGPLAVRAVKESAMRGLNMSLEDGLRLESHIFRAVRDTEDSKEGPKAFAEKRTPQFTGR